MLFRLDRTGISLAIAGTATPIAMLALRGWDTAGPVVVAVVLHHAMGGATLLPPPDTGA